MRLDAIATRVQVIALRLDAFRILIQAKFESKKVLASNI